MFHKILSIKIHQQTENYHHPHYSMHQSGTKCFGYMTTYVQLNDIIKCLGKISEHGTDRELKCEVSERYYSIFHDSRIWHITYQLSNYQ